MKAWLKVFYALLLIFILPINATEFFVQNQNEDTIFLFNEITQTEEKVYIQPSSIYVSSNQIYVKIAEDLIPIQHLSCDDSGIFVSIQDLQTGRGRQETWICQKCGYENYVGINACGICGRSRYDMKKADFNK